MVVIIDHEDSFVYMLSALIARLGYRVRVIPYKDLTLGLLRGLSPSHVLLSPGPMAPKHFPLSTEVLHEYVAKVPILGVCLGHQLIAEYFLAKVCPAKYPLHGQVSRIFHNNQGLFHGLTNPLFATRYHALAVYWTDSVQDLELHAYAEDMEIMAVAHKRHPVFGLQFHPESLLTECGAGYLQNFLRY
jgi:anthranilate synthase/aminodeoxychorismate synthase-like glutamine amidotransferase